MRYVCDAERCAIMERFEEHKGTLNGKPAIICGRLLDFPSVAALDGSVRVEYAWSTLASLSARGVYSLWTVGP